MTATLDHLLADLKILDQKLRNYHWNVKGPHFFVLHAEFEKLYDAIALQADAVAERIVALGRRPAATFAEYLQLTSLKEDPTIPDAHAMVRAVLHDLVAVTSKARALGAAAEASPATTHLLDTLADELEQTAWMLRSYSA